MVDVAAPPEEQEGPFWKGPEPLVMEAFQGVDTNSSRYGVDPKQCAWINGWIPLGHAKLRTLPDVGAAIFTASVSAPGTTVLFYDFANIGISPVCIIFLSDGSIWQITTDTLVVTNIAPAGTILNPSMTNVGVSQWGSQFVIIVANQPNGYWIWDGAFLYTSGTIAPNPVVINNGSGYTFAPTITTYGGSGTGVSLIAIYNN